MTIHPKDLMDSLRSRVCPACGKTKRTGQTLCGDDYYSLSMEKRAALYDRLGRGYEQAVDAAMQAIGVDRFIMPDGEQIVIPKEDTDGDLRRVPRGSTPRPDQAQRQAQ